MGHSIGRNSSISWKRLKWIIACFVTEREERWKKGCWTKGVNSEPLIKVFVITFYCEIMNERAFSSQKNASQCLDKEQQNISSSVVLKSEAKTWKYFKSFLPVARVLYFIRFKIKFYLAVLKNAFCGSWLKSAEIERAGNFYCSTQKMGKYSFSSPQIPSQSFQSQKWCYYFFPLLIVNIFAASLNVELKCRIRNWHSERCLSRVVLKLSFRIDDFQSLSVRKQFFEFLLMDMHNALVLIYGFV